MDDSLGILYINSRIVKQSMVFIIQCVKKVSTSQPQTKFSIVLVTNALLRIHMILFLVLDPHLNLKVGNTVEKGNES